MKEITEGEEYEIPFISGSNNLCLNVYLSKDFPNEKPSLKIIPSIVHPWISADGEVTSAPGLLNVRISLIKYILRSNCVFYIISLQYIPIWGV